MHDYRRLLRDNPAFARLWFSGAISQIGDWFHTIVMLALISRLSNGSGLALSAYFLANSIPSIIVMPYAGILADRLDRKRLLIASDVLRAVIIVLLLVSASAGILWAIYALVMARASLTAIFDPTKQALIPQVVRFDDLVLANTLDSMSWSAMLALGAIAGGVVASLFGPTVALLLDAGTFLLSAAVIATVVVPPAQEDTPRSDHLSLVADFREGLAYARQNLDVGASLLIKSFGALASMDTSIGIFATQLFVLGADGEQSLSILYAALGVGAVAGPLILNRFHDGSVDSLRQSVVVGLVALLIGFLVISGSGSIWMLALGMMIASMGGSTNWTYSSVLIQKSTPNAILGRIFSLDLIVLRLVTTIMLVLIGGLTDLLGAAHIRQVTAIQSGLLILPLVFWIGYLIYRRSGRALPVAEMGD